MKLTNRTGWRTSDLRAIIVRALRERDLNPRDYTVIVTWARQGSWCTGRGSYQSPWIKIRIPNPGTLVVPIQKIVDDFAFVTDHELLHTMGMHHDEMRRDGFQDRCGARPDEPMPWAQGMQLRQQEAPKKPTSKDRTEARAEHAHRMLIRGESKLSRAKTIVRRWKTKVAYYDRKRIAASPTGEGPKDHRTQGP